MGGPSGPYRQSERLARYARRSRRSAPQGSSTRASARARRSRRRPRRRTAPRTRGRDIPGPAARWAPGRWRGAIAARRPAWRFRVPAGPVAFDDGVHGPRALDVLAEVGDFVVARADGIPAYQLAVVVDDAAMGITEVVRGDDLLPSTARQLLLYRALGLHPPRFAHVPLVVGEDGSRLAKRHGALSLGELRARGADPAAVTGLLAALSGLAPAGARVAPRELVAGFTLRKLATTPAVLTAGAVEALLGCEFSPSDQNSNPMRPSKPSSGDFVAPGMPQRARPQAPMRKGMTGNFTERPGRKP